MYVNFLLKISILVTAGQQHLLSSYFVRNRTEEQLVYGEAEQTEFV